MKRITISSIKRTLSGKLGLKQYQKSPEYQNLNTSLRTDLSEALKNDWYAVIFKGNRPLDGGLAPYGVDVPSFIDSNGSLKSGLRIEFYETEEEFEEAYYG